ncbi:MAG: sigma 54-dependent Fis family transcriptional regulator [Kofleriaceae bacterium]|nr:sigma 54-dependent Fis family transcriptional regulator [Kofleriaceae bacterium]MBP6836679.1 sigma 54-dependent Fis family transcriptional regulator [Kofleriaceae bacterium]
MEHLAGTRIRREATPATVNLRRCKLVVIKGPQRATEFLIAGDVIRVGKAPENDLALSDETVSRVHFEIVRDAKGYLVRDMKSTNGTFLDGAEIKEAYLRTGSVIGAGSSELKFTPFEERIEILPSERDHLGEMVGRSAPMREIFGLIEKIAPTDATVLIEGETGTGKDMVARTLHQLSRRKDAPFIVVDCGAVAGTLIESELFGHEKGAFTGAVAARQGAFELASGGTVFLDELGELSLDLQPKLLRVLEQRELRRVGGSKTTKVDIRVIAATRKDLRSEVEKGKFREDLYFRLNVVPITAPPLRDRREDIPLLVDNFLAKADTGPVTLSDSTRAALMAHDWPGNVRELRNVLERAAALGGDPGVLVAPLAELGPRAAASAAAAAAASTTAAGRGDWVDFEPGLSYRDTKEKWNEQFERRYLTWLLRRADGNISKAARDADMDRKYLHKLLRKYGIAAADVGDEAGPD